jgi:uncharacterized membrane protein YphA (DoxX/SURF4 family)
MHYGQVSVMLFKRFMQIRWAVLLAAYQNPAAAHVKWFLSKTEAELLSLPKPALFTQWRGDNFVAVVLTMSFLCLAHKLNKRFSGSRLNARLNRWAARLDSHVQLAMGLFVGLMLLYSAWTMCFFVPNLHLHACCKWIASIQGIIGAAMLLGLFTRPAALVMLGMLAFSFAKFPLNDCVDLLPMYGIGLYMLIGGRGKFSLDQQLGFSSQSTQSCELATWLLRVALGAGLLALGLDEKLLNPQLAMNLLQTHPVLNVLQGYGVGNDMFVLISGLIEVALGIAIALGIFPRLCVLALVVLFTATTVIFGGAEFVGHLPYYAVFAAILLRGANCRRMAVDYRAQEISTSGRLATAIVD